MPCTKCENGKYKWGKTGECKYDSKEACEKANKKNYNKMRPTPLGKTYEQYEKEVNDYKEINLSKVEKVELSVVSDIADALKTGDEGLSKANRLSDNIVKLNTTLLNVIDSIGSMEVQLSNVLDAENSLGYAIQSYEFVAKKIETSVKELGISANDIDGYKQLTSQVTKYKKAKDELTKYAKFGKETLKKIKR